MCIHPSLNKHSRNAHCAGYDMGSVVQECLVSSSSKSLCGTHKKLKYNMNGKVNPGPGAETGGQSGATGQSSASAQSQVSLNHSAMLAETFLFLRLKRTTH